MQEQNVIFRHEIGRWREYPVTKLVHEGYIP